MLEIASKKARVIIIGSRVTVCYHTCAANCVVGGAMGCGSVGAHRSCPGAGCSEGV